MPNATVDESPDADRWLAESWSAHLAEVLETMTGERPRHSLADAGQQTAPPAGESGFHWWEQPLSSPPEATVWIGASEPAWSAIGERVLKAADIEEAEPSDSRQTYLEILQQSLSALSQTVGTRLGTEVTCEEGREIPDPPSHPPAILEISYAEEEKITFLAAFHPSLGEALDRQAEQEAETQPEATPPDEAGNGEPEMPPASASTSAPRTIDLLLDVELPVSISFGRAHLPLKDVLKLTSGSIVELNRSVSEPVEIIVNNCVVAQGEVVVVDGNYGVRISRIISRQQRLRTLN